jgi:spore coat protein U-like protein
MKFATMGRFAAFAACAGMLSVLAPNVAGAATSSTGTLTVTASVADNCTVSNATLAFGAYDPLVTNATTDLAGSTSVTYACVKDPGHVIWIDMGVGSNSGLGPVAGDNAMKEITNGTDYLSYQLYQDGAHTLKWGTGDPGGTATSGKGVRVTSPGIAGTTITVYGLVPQAQNVTASTTYSDAVTETINF